MACGAAAQKKARRGGQAGFKQVWGQPRTWKTHVTPHSYFFTSLFFEKTRWKLLKSAVCEEKNGRGGEIRTPDLLHPKQAR